MSHSLVFKLRISLISFLCLFIYCNGAFSQSWREKLQQKAEQVKEKVNEKAKEVEHPCRKCGKLIHVGDECATCMAAKAKEQTTSAAENVSSKASQAINQGVQGLGNVVGQGMKAYDEARKPDWQKFIESGTGMAIIGGGVFIALFGFIFIVKKRQ